MLTHKEIQQYWNERAASDTSAQSTTGDVFLRQIELSVLKEHISKASPCCVADVGCGDGRTTAGLAQSFRHVQFEGLDYADSMVQNATSVNQSLGLNNLSFNLSDICNGLTKAYDLIYTTRCLINLPGWDLQKKALLNIRAALNPNGTYIMIENFVEGHQNFNRIRKSFGLPEIPIREHNFFFAKKRLLDFVRDIFTLVEENNISSTYYLVSRIIYSKICADNNLKPDYFDPHHKYGAKLPFCGEFGPVRMLILKTN